MNRIIWTAPALYDLDSIADYISLDKPLAAAKLVKKVLKKTELLLAFPMSGRKLPELPNLTYRELIVKPCRIIYRIDRDIIYIVLVMRGEQQDALDRLRG